MKACTRGTSPPLAGSAARPAGAVGERDGLQTVHPGVADQAVRVVPGHDGPCRMARG
jgi:hypothetical protein